MSQPRYEVKLGKFTYRMDKRAAKEMLETAQDEGEQCSVRCLTTGRITMVCHKDGHHFMATENKAEQWKTASKKTCAELLYNADDGGHQFTAVQRAVMIGRADKEYNPNPFEKRKGEDVEDYMARLKRNVNLYAKRMAAV